MKKIAFAVFILLAGAAAVILVRTARFESRQLRPQPVKPIVLDPDALARRLSGAIKFETISTQAQDDSSNREFNKLHAFLTTSFPRVHRQLDKEIVNSLSLLYTWKGKDARLKPLLLMAHMDVVPVDGATENSWTHPPFSGAIAGGHVWGRGAMDDKASVVGILEAVEHLLDEGFVPERTIYIAFGHDEEIGGINGAAKIAALLRSRGVELEFVLDEGMNVLNGIIGGITAPVALIGIAEKGYLSIRLTAETPGGHSSIPPADTAIGAVSRALQRLEAAPFPASLRGPTRSMLDFIGPEMPWARKLPLANLWLFEPIVRQQMTDAPLTNATLRTTLVPTIFNAGVKENVLPSQANAIVNLRIMPGESTEGALHHVRQAIDDPRIKLAPLPIRMEPSAVADIDGASFKLIQRTIGEIMPEAVVAPALLVAATDSRHYAALTKNIFRFLPITLKPADTARYHGIDERISLEDYARCVRFYAQLIRNSNPR